MSTPDWRYDRLAMSPWLLELERGDDRLRGLSVWRSLGRGPVDPPDIRVEAFSLEILVGEDVERVAEQRERGRPRGPRPYDGQNGLRPAQGHITDRKRH